MRLTIIWIISIVFTLTVVIYQRLTGPTYPVKISYNELKFKLPRSSSVDIDCKINIPGNSMFDAARVLWKYYPGDYSYDTLPLSLNGDKWEAVLPVQPPAGKLQYYIELEANGKITFDTSQSPVVIRFKGAVPSWALLPHIFFMFAATLLSIAALFMVIFNTGNYKLIATLTLAGIAIGGMIFGPIVQKFAFGHYWTGFPFGYDLTDNKTLLVFIIWAIAVFANLKAKRKWWIVAATLAMIAINSIPHSTMGSELNRNSGKVETSK
jgi:hypothetical protein